MITKTLRLSLFSSLVALTVALSGCAGMDNYDPYYSGGPSYGGGYNGGGYGYGNRDPYYGGGYYGGGYNDPYRNRRERERLEEERERLERERERLERERQRQRYPESQPVPRPPAASYDRCPAGFSPSENKCSRAERERGCKDIRMPSGLGCVKR